MGGRKMEKAGCPKVSVVMTTYQAQEHIKKSIESVRRQSIKEMELVCIDGGSTDGTTAIIKSFQEKDQRIKLYGQERPGIGAAKNCGIEKAKGEYITFLDADDYYVDPDALKQMYQACVDKQVKICGALRTTVYMDGSVAKEPLHRYDVQGNGQGVLLKYKDRQYDYHFHSYLYKRSMVMENKIRFAEVTAYDDTHFFIRAMMQAGEFYIIPVELYRYRCGPAYDWGNKKAEDALEALTDQLKVTAENHLDDLHWLTVQRINYEYGDIFEKNVRSGDMRLLKQLLQANDCIAPAVMEKAQQGHVPENWYIEAMMHRLADDMPVKSMHTPEGKKYILEPVWRLLHLDGQTEDIYKRQNEQLRDEIVRIKSSYAFKIGNAILYLPRKIKGIFKYAKGQCGCSGF